MGKFKIKDILVACVLVLLAVVLLQPTVQDKLKSGDYNKKTEKKETTVDDVDGLESFELECRDFLKGLTPDKLTYKTDDVVEFSIDKVPPKGEKFYSGFTEPEEKMEYLNILGEQSDYIREEILPKLDPYLTEGTQARTGIFSKDNIIRDCEFYMDSTCLNYKIHNISVYEKVQGDEWKYGEYVDEDMKKYVSDNGEISPLYRREDDGNCIKKDAVFIVLEQTIESKSPWPYLEQITPELLLLEDSKNVDASKYLEGKNVSYDFERGIYPSYGLPYYMDKSFYVKTNPSYFSFHPFGYGDKITVKLGYFIEKDELDSAYFVYDRGNEMMSALSTDQFLVKISDWGKEDVQE